MFIPDPDLDFLPIWIPDPGIKKAPDPGSGSEALFATVLLRYCMNTTVPVFGIRMWSTTVFLRVVQIQFFSGQITKRYGSKLLFRSQIRIRIGLALQYPDLDYVGNTDPTRSP
jgi:hypothetical protein